MIFDREKSNISMAGAPFIFPSVVSLAVVLLPLFLRRFGLTLAQLMPGFFFLSGASAAPHVVFYTSQVEVNHAC